MRILHLSIRNFRGIQTFDWSPPSPFCCLVGAGDSRKTTILDAIQLVLSPRRFEPFDDADFFEGRVENPITIEITVGDLPDGLIEERKFGLYLRGWTATKKLRDEPQETDERVLSIRLVVEDSMEPVWVVFNGREPDGKPIAAKDRELLGVFRFGDYADRELSWGHGTVLSRLTGSAEVRSKALAAAARSARSALSSTDLADLNAVAAKAETLGRAYGVQKQSAYEASLDIAAVQVRSGGISLHDGDVPVRRAGLGTRRLLTLALQREFVRNGGVILIDEVEHGLEPHRLRWLLHKLRETSDQAFEAQVIFTTHSSITVAELEAAQLNIVLSRAGITQVVPVSSSLQKVVRSHPEALLGRAVVVCEGPTEWGVVRALDASWAAEGRKSMALIGVVATAGTKHSGAGSEAPQHAADLAMLGYDVVLFCDSDRTLTPSAEDLERCGVKVIQWDGGHSIEQRVFDDLPWEAVLAALEIAIEQRGIQSVRDSVAHILEVDTKAWPENLENWDEVGSEEDLRAAFGLTAKKAGWFKRPDLGHKLGRVVAQVLNDIPASDLAIKIAKLRDWIGSLE